MASVNATLVILETTVIARQKLLHACLTMARCAVGGAAAYVGGASAVSQGHLGTRAKNVQPVQMPVEQRGMRMLKLTANPNITTFLQFKIVEEAFY